MGKVILEFDTSGDDGFYEKKAANRAATATDAYGVIYNLLNLENHGNKQIVSAILEEYKKEYNCENITIEDLTIIIARITNRLVEESSVNMSWYE